MYIKDRCHQLGLAELDQPVGLKINLKNRCSWHSDRRSSAKNIDASIVNWWSRSQRIHITSISLD